MGYSGSLSNIVLAALVPRKTSFFVHIYTRIGVAKPIQNLRLDAWLRFEAERKNPPIPNLLR